ncbi:MAG: phosphatidylglycerophosphatase A [Calditrichaeota bacterium]|nr:phosphatidylglycerophosphatase A [Calditrichota bacterium]
MKVFNKNIKDFPAYFTTTLAGIGYFPKAPGTAASFFAVICLFFLNPDALVLFTLVILAIIAGIIWTPVIERNDGKDASHIVIDELAGQWITFLIITRYSVLILLAGFLLFRIFDIWKPFGINRIQNLPGGWGVMLDDILAGIYAAGVLYVLSYWKVL